MLAKGQGLVGMRTAAGGIPESWANTLPPLAIVLLVMLIGASIYLWRSRILKSRAALVTIVALALVLAYLGFFAVPPPP